MLHTRHASHSQHDCGMYVLHHPWAPPTCMFQDIEKSLRDLEWNDYDMPSQGAVQKNSEESKDLFAELVRPPEKIRTLTDWSQCLWRSAGSWCIG